MSSIEGANYTPLTDSNLKGHSAGGEEGVANMQQPIWVGGWREDGQGWESTFMLMPSLNLAMNSRNAFNMSPDGPVLHPYSPCTCR